MPAYTHPTVDPNVQSLTEWVDQYNLLVTDINATGLRLGATLVGNGASSSLTVANTNLHVGNATANVVLYGNGHAYISGDLTVGGTIVGATVTVPLANTTVDGLMSITTQSLAGDKTFTGSIWASSGVRVSGPVVLGATSGPGILSYEYPTIRLYAGDGTGYSFAISRRTGSVTTDLFTVSDSGAVGVSGTLTATSLIGPLTGTANNATNLNGQAASYYTNASNMSTGTVPSGRLSGTYSISVSGNAGTVTDGTYLTSAQTLSGRKSFTGGQNATMATATANLGAVEVYADATVDTTRPAFMTFHRGGQSSTYFGYDSDGQFKFGGWSHGTTLNTFLHTGNYSTYLPTGGSGVILNIGALLASSPAALLGSNGTSILRYNTADVAVGSASVATSVNGNLNSPSWAKIGIQGGVDGTSARGIFLYQTSDPNWGIYMAQSGASRALNDGTAPAGLGSGRTSWHMRFRAASTVSNGFLWENSTNAALMSLGADTGDLTVLGPVTASTVYANWFRAQADTGLYFQAYSRGLWAPDSGGCIFGNVQCYGTGRGGWNGYAVNSRHVYMSNGSTESGLYDTSVGWVMKWDGASATYTYNIHPHVTGSYYLGTSSLKWKSAFFDLTSVASGSQVVTNASGELQYISSSVRYKTDIRPLDTHLDPVSWLSATPVVYRDKAQPDAGQYYGFLAEDLHDKGFGSLVVYDAEGRPNSVMYDRATVLLTAIVKQQHERISQLEARLARLGV